MGRIYKSNQMFVLQHFTHKRNEAFTSPCKENTPLYS